jgi:4-hydroxy-tetrahydrodipicolinate reductase
MTPIRVVFTGATGRVGRSLIPAILRSADFVLVGAVGRHRAGEDVGVALGVGEVGVRIEADVEDAVRDSGGEVLIDFSAPEVAVKHCRAGIESGMAVVMGTTAMAPQDVEELGELADERGVGAFKAPNLTLAGQLMFRCAELVRHYMGDVEIVEAHMPEKLDSPSGTALETAERLERVSGPPPGQDHTRFGIPESRGAQVGSVRIHSLRLPSIYDHQEVIFSRPGELLSIRYEQYTTEPLIGPTLKAARLVLGVRGLVRDFPDLFEPDSPISPHTSH